MGKNGEEAIGSMGTDTPLAVLSDKPQLLYNYFKQLFAQVTNPPLDAIREEIVTSVKTVIGPEGNLLDPQPESCHLISAEDAVHRQRPARAASRRSTTASCAPTRPADAVPAGNGPEALEHALDELCKQADEAIDEGATILVLSDRGVDRRERADPVAARRRRAAQPPGARGEAHAASGSSSRPATRARRTTSRCCSATARARSTRISRSTRWRRCTTKGCVEGDLTYEEAAQHYLKAVKKGVVKIMSKMGISTIQSYRGAQIFEAIGLGRELVDKYFTKTASRIGGIGLDAIAKDTLCAPPARLPDARGRARRADVGRPVPVAPRRRVPPVQPGDGLPAAARHAHRPGDIFREYTKMVNEQSRAAVHAARPVRVQARPRAGPDRGGRAGRERCSSASRPARCRSARSAQRRTRRWRSR